MSSIGSQGKSSSSQEDSSPAQFVQSILQLRSRAPVASEEILTRVRMIEPLLHDTDPITPNWRRGISGTSGTMSSSRRQHMGGGGGGGSGGAANRWKNTNTVTSHEQPMVSAPYQKYQSRFKNTEAPVEETILNSIILNKLNKFSAKTYTEVRDFLYQILDNGETGFTKEFMRLVFKKSAAEDIFCPLYAKLLSELRTTYPVIQTEMNELFQSYITIFKDLDESESVDYKMFIERNIEKKYRLGYSQFLAELVILETVDLSSLQETFEVLITNIFVFGSKENKSNEIQEYADCLLRMARVVHKKNTNFFVNLRKQLYACIRVKLEEILESTRETFPSITPKSRFALMDIRDNLQKN